MRLIRDADKLDIWRIFINYYNDRNTPQNQVLELGVIDRPECSESILDALSKGA
jgi:hypothetical protein